MCLGVPGKVLSVEPNPLGMTMGQVAFGGIRKEVCLAYVPDVQVGEYVIVHVGFALHKIDADEARAVFKVLEEMGELAELEEPGEGGGPP